MKLLKKILLIILVLPILLIVISFFLPSQYRVERVTVINAPAEAIYPWLEQLKKWPDWTVWNTTYDPTLAAQMDVAEKIMREDRAVLRKLAQ